MTSVDGLPSPGRHLGAEVVDAARSGLGWLVLDGPLPLLLSVVAVVALLKDGLAPVPNIGTWLAIAKAFPHDPGLPAAARYLQSSPIGPGVAHLLHLTSLSSYMLLHLTVLILGLALTIHGLWRRSGRRAAGLGAVLFLACPVSCIGLTWLGMQDAWLVGAFGVLAVYEDPRVLALAAAIGAMAHPEMTGIVVVGIGLLRLLDAPATAWPRIGASLGGLIVGALLTVAYELNAGGGVGSDGSYMTMVGIGTLAADWLRCLPFWLWSAFGAGWLWLCATLRLSGTRRLAAATAAYLAVATVMAVVTLDETRVFALLSWPLVLWWVVRRTRVSAGLVSGRLASMLLLVAAIVPNVVVQAGHVHITP